MPIEKQTVFEKTPKGINESQGRWGIFLNKTQKVLSLVDGKLTVGELVSRSGMKEQKLVAELETLLQERLIRETWTPVDQFSVNVSPGEHQGIHVTVANTQAYMEAMNKQKPKEEEELISLDDIEEKLLREAEQLAKREEAERQFQIEAKVREESERKAREEAQRAREEVERKAKEEAERLAREEEERRAREEAERLAREEAERKASEEEAQRAREEAERKAREEAERLAREEEDRRAREEAERLAREKAERQAREEEEQRAREEAERKAKEEAERLAREEEERRAREEAERLAREEAERQAREAEEQRAREEAERKAKEEAERLAREEEERRAREEAERKAKEEAERKEKEEAERKAREERIAKRLKAREEEEQRAREEAERKAREEAERLAREEEERRAREEAERLAREEAERKASEEEEQRAREEAERKAKEEAEHLAREEEERRAREEAERLAREKAERQAREEEEQRVREEAERKAREEAERLAREEEERRAREEAERLAREEAERQAREEEEQRVREEAERKAREEAERLAREEEEHRAREEAERKAKEEAERRAHEEDERQAREEERKAREVAELKAREAEEQKILERQAREEAECLAKQEKEQRAREESERKAQEKAERKAREEAEKQAKLEAKRLAREQAVPGETMEKLLPWLKWGGAGILGLLLVALAAIHFVPLGSSQKALEKLASTSLGEPVKMAALNLALFPSPHLKLRQIQIGNQDALRIADARIYAGWGTLFGSGRQVERIELNKVELASGMLVAVASWPARNASQPAAYQIAQVALRNIQISAGASALLPMKGEFNFSSAGSLEKSWLGSEDGSLRADFSPSATGLGVSVSVKDMTPLSVLPLKIDSLQANGTISGKKLHLAEVTGTSHGGKMSGSLTLSWDQDWSVAGDVRIASARLTPPAKESDKLQVSGQLDASLSFLQQAQTLELLFKQPLLNGSVTLREGAVHGFDLPAALHYEVEAIYSGQTAYDSWSFKLEPAGESQGYRAMRMAGKGLLIEGKADVSTQGAISGMVKLQVEGKKKTARGNYNLGGTLERPVIRRVP